MSNPNHIPVDHPVRALLRLAAHADLTSGTLRQHLDGWDDHLPEGQSLARFRGDVNRAAARVRALGRAGANGRAQALADELAAEFAGRMTDEERAVTGEPDPEPLGNITARMFGH